MAFPRSRRARVVAIVLLVVLAAVGGLTFYVGRYVGLFERSWNGATIAAAEAQGNGLIALLNRYRAANGRYPATLQALVPTYTPRIDAPAAGARRWQYKSDGSNFLLRFGTEALNPGGDLYPCDTFDTRWPVGWQIDT